MTADDIAQGKVVNCRLCPIARAVNRHLLPGTFASVDGVTVHIRMDHDFNDEVIGLVLPPEARNFVGKFDNGATVQPFTFEL